MNSFRRTAVALVSTVAFGAFALSVVPAANADVTPPAPRATMCTPIGVPGTPVSGPRVERDDPPGNQQARVVVGLSPLAIDAPSRGRFAVRQGVPTDAGPSVRGDAEVCAGSPSRRLTA